MQCKDIPDRPILTALRDAPWLKCHDITSWGTMHFGFPNSVQNWMPPEVPQKLAQAKMRSLVSRGLVDGCCCGCRGDFEITKKGVEFLAFIEGR